MHARTFAIALGALLLSLGLAGGAHAAPQVDVEYNLDDTTMMTQYRGLYPICNDTSKTCSLNGSISGSMKVRYTGTSTGTGITPGAAELLTFDLTLNNSLKSRIYSVKANGDYNYDSQGNILTGTIGWHLDPATATGAATGGLLTAGDQLTVASLSLRRQMNLHCVVGGTGCTGAHLVTTQTLSSFTDESAPLRSPQTIPGLTSPPGTLSLSRTATNGDLRSGVGSGIGAIVLAKGNFLWAGNYTGVGIGPKEVKTVDDGFTTVPMLQLVGREVSRTAVPEPGSLLLLGSGLAGLAALGGGGAVGHRLRRRRREDA